MQTSPARTVRAAALNTLYETLVSVLPRTNGANEEAIGRWFLAMVLFEVHDASSNYQLIEERMKIEARSRHLHEGPQLQFGFLQMI